VCSFLHIDEDCGEVLLRELDLSHLTHLDICGNFAAGGLVGLPKTVPKLKALTHLAIVVDGDTDMTVIDGILLNPDHKHLKSLVLNSNDLPTMPASMPSAVQQKDKRIVRLATTWMTFVDYDQDWLAGICGHRLDRWEIIEGIGRREEVRPHPSCCFRFRSRDVADALIFYCYCQENISRIRKMDMYGSDLIGLG